MSLNEEQFEALLQGINPARVSEVQGMSHVEAYDIRAMLIRIFGFTGFSLTETSPTEMLYEMETSTKQGKPAFKVAYRASIRLTIGDCAYDGTAVGEATMPDFKRGDCHDMAIKTAESQALKRCAINLGDQFGLSLYNNGQTAPTVRKAWFHDKFITVKKDA